MVTFWKDCTEEYEQEREAKRADQVLKCVSCHSDFRSLDLDTGSKTL